jgi:hypothetical protein
MHTQSARTKGRRWLTLALLAAGWCARVDAVGVPATLPAEPPAQASQEQPVAAIPPAMIAQTQAPAPEALLQWEFSYKGYRIKAEGTVMTRAEPRPDGTYEIVSVTGKRNKRDILRLQPAGELMTMYGLLFADNRLWAQSPYLTQSGFTFRMGRGRFFNVCYSGPYEGCGNIADKDYRPGYYEYDFRGEERPIEFTLKRLDTLVVAIVPPAETESAPETLGTCQPAPDSPSAGGVGSAALAVAAFATTAPAASNAVTCLPADLPKNRL